MSKVIFYILDIGLTILLFCSPLFYAPMLKYVNLVLTNNTGTDSDAGLIFLVVAWFIICAASVYTFLNGVKSIIAYFIDFTNKFFV